MTQAFSWPHVLHRLLSREPLSEEEASAAMEEIMEGAATPAQIAGFVVALRAKGETTEEIVGLVRTMRSFAATIDVGADVLDTCGTGGDRLGTFNVSTAAAIVCAGAGAKVAKHGNRAASSRCGSADVLEALGVAIDLPPDAVGECIAEAGIGFCFAPLFHPAMRHAGGPRRELGVATVFNFLGPLTNPAGARRQALGVSDLRMLDKMVEALARLGSERVIAFHGDSGIDELATSGPSEIVELKGGQITRLRLDPEEIGVRRADLDEIAGGTAQENAAAVRAVLAGESGPRRDIVALNASAGLVATGLARDFKEGLQVAAGTIDSGAAAAALDRLIDTSNRLRR